MSNKVITMQQVRAVLQYLTKGYSLRAISRELGMSRKTVTQYHLRLQGHTPSLQELQSISDAELAAIVYEPVKPTLEDPRKADFISRIDYFLKELKRTGITRLLLWQEYLSAYPDGWIFRIKVYHLLRGKVYHHYGAKGATSRSWFSAISE